MRREARTSKQGEEKEEDNMCILLYHNTHTHTLHTHIHTSTHTHKAMGKTICNHPLQRKQ